MQQLRQIVTPGDLGGPTLSAVYGDVGHGKSTVLDEISEYASSAGQQVISMHGDVPDIGIPYAGLHWLLSRNVNLLDRCEHPSAKLLRRVLVDFTPPDSILSMCSSVTAWFECLAPNAPLLPAVDDADQLDEESLRVLAFVAARQQSGRLTVILTATKVIPLFERVEAQRFQLDDLEPSDALQVATSVGVATNTAHQLVHRLGGNPLALIRVGEQIVNGATAIHDDEPLPLPLRLQNDVEERLEGLPAETLHLLEVVAATKETGLPALDSWSRAANRGPIQGLFDSAEEAGIVDFDGHSMSWRRRWMAEAVLHRCTDCRRRRLRDESMTSKPEQPTAQAMLAVLTPAERRVMEVVVDGASTRETANFLGIKEKTIDCHLQSIYRKLDVRSRTQLVAVALRAEMRDAHGG